MLVRRVGPRRVEVFDCAVWWRGVAAGAVVLVLVALLASVTACGQLPPEGGAPHDDDVPGDARRPAVVGFASFVRPGATLTAEVLGWAGALDAAAAVRLTPGHDHLSVVGAPVRVTGGAVRFDLRVAPEATAGDLVTSAELIDASGAVVSPAPASVTLHVLPDVAPLQLESDVLDVRPLDVDDGWLVIETDLSPGEHLAVIAYDPRERHLLTRLQVQGFGFAEGPGLVLSDPEHGVERAAMSLEVATGGLTEAYLAHLEHEARFLEMVDRLGLQPLHALGPAPRRLEHPTHRRFRVPNFLEGGTSYVDTTLRAVSEHALVYVQDDHVPRAFEQPEAVAAAFDEIYAPVRALWGEESDIDGNGRVILIVTPLTGYAAVVQAADLFGGNGGEIVYGAIADAGVLAHEFTHVITNHRKRVLQGARPPAWEMEGIAVTTEVLLGTVPAWPFEGVLQRPWNARAFVPYGVPTLLVLAAGERAGGTEAGAWQAMHDTPTVGAAMIEALTGVPFATHVGDVATALLLHGTPFEVDPYRFVNLDLGSLDRHGLAGERLPPLAYNALPNQARSADLVNLRYFVSGPANGGPSSVVVRHLSARAHLRVLRLPSALPYAPDRLEPNWRVEGNVFKTWPGSLLIAEGRVGDATADLSFDVAYEGDGEVAFELRHAAPWLHVSPERGTVRAGDPGVRFTLRFEPCAPDDPPSREADLFLPVDGRGGGFAATTVRYVCGRGAEPPSVHAFVAAARDVTPVSATELRWAVSGQGPLEVTITPDLGDVSDRWFAVVHPERTTTYELRASNPHGAASARLVIGACTDPHEVVFVPDPALAAALRRALDLRPEDDLTCRAMAALETLDADNSDIADPRGLEAAVGLSELVLSGNSIGSLDPLAGLANLELLRVASTGIDRLDPLAELSNLYFLEAFGNQIRDLTPLTSLPRLMTLVLMSNPIESAAPLVSMPSLQILVLSETGLDDLGFLTGLPDLFLLDIWGNAFVDLDGVERASGLRELSAGANWLESIDALLEAPGLTEGAFVNVEHNCLDVSLGSPARAVIDTLLARGVEVRFERQRPDYQCGDRLPVIRSFEAAPSEIESGAYATLTWHVQGLAPLLVTLNGEPTGTNGNASWPLTETTTFTLRAENDYGSAEASVTVTVVP